MRLRIEHCWRGVRECWEVVRYELGRRVVVCLADSEREATLQLVLRWAGVPVRRKVCR